LKDTKDPADNPTILQYLEVRQLHMEHWRRDDPQGWRLVNVSVRKQTLHNYTSQSCISGVSKIEKELTPSS
jgi:hypothetical protein